MVSVFKTDVSNNEDAAIVTVNIASSYPSAKVTFDLDDCDRVLRIEGRDVSENEILNICSALGFSCETLD